MSAHMVIHDSDARADELGVGALPCGGHDAREVSAEHVGKGYLAGEGMLSASRSVVAGSRHLQGADPHDHFSGPRVRGGYLFELHDRGGTEFADGRGPHRFEKLT